MTNEFRTVPSLKNLYEINSDGTVIRNLKTGHIMRPHVDFNKKKPYKTQYLRVWVIADGMGKYQYVHSLVAECWLGKRPEGLQVDHIDRNTFNNYYKNLRYVDSKAQRQNSVGIHSPLQIILSKDKEKIYFECMSDAAKALQKYYPEKPLKTLFSSFARRHNKILGFDVEYFRYGKKILGRTPKRSRIPKTIILKFGGEKFQFNSFSNAAKALSEIYPSKTFKAFMNYLNNRKGKIFDIEIEYFDD